LKKLEVSPSAFIAYLGLKSKLNIDPPHYVTWLFSTYDIEKSYCGHLKNYDPQEKDFDYLLVSFPTLVDPSLAKKDKSIIRLLVGARYLRKGLWEKHREDIFQKMLKKLNSLLPNIQDDIEIKEMAGPPTLNRYTSNKNGSLFGWASTSSQIDKNVFPTLTSVENLYLTGHWVTNGAGQGGVSPSAFFGKITSRAILKNPIIINSK
jgi:prolycopene isomerase